MDKTHSRFPLIVAGTLLLLPVLYLGSYLALVTPSGTIIADISSPYTYQTMESGRVVERAGRLQPYRAWNSQCQRIFWPLEKIDRASRPEAWSPNEWPGW